MQTIEEKSSKFSNIREIYQTVFMIQKIIIVHQETSLPVFDKNVESTVPYEAAIISGILQAISSIGQEMVGRPTGFKKLQFNGFVVTGSYFNGYMIYVFSEPELDKEVEKGLKTLVQWFSITFNTKRSNWDGTMDIFRINKAIIESKIAQCLYLWLLYPFEPEESSQIGINDLSSLGQEIYGCICKNLRCTAAKLLDHFKKFGEENILSEIHNLVLHGLIKTSYCD